MRSSDYCKCLLTIILCLSLNSNAQLTDAAKSLGYAWLGDQINVADKKAGKHLISTKEFNISSPVARQIVSLDSKNFFNGLWKIGLADPDRGLSKVLSQYFIPELSLLQLPGADPKIYIAKMLEHSLTALKNAHELAPSEVLAQGIKALEALGKKTSIYNTKIFADELRACINSVDLDLTKDAQAAEYLQAQAAEHLHKAAQWAGNSAIARTAGFNALLKLNSIKEHATRYDDFIHEWKKAHTQSINGTLPAIKWKSHAAWEQLVITKEMIEEDPQTFFVAFSHAILSHALVLVTQILGDIGARGLNVAWLQPEAMAGRAFSIALGMLVSYGLQDYAEEKLHNGFKEFNMYDPHYDKVYDSAYVVGVKAPFAWTAWRAIYDYATIFAIQLITAATLIKAYPQEFAPLQRNILGWLTLSVFTLAYNLIPFNDILWKTIFITADIAKDGAVLAYQTARDVYVSSQDTTVVIHTDDTFEDDSEINPKDEL